MKKIDLHYAVKKEISSIELAIDYLELVTAASEHDKRNLQRAVEHLNEAKKNLQDLVKTNKKETENSLIK